ncbi:MAG: ATP-binding protein [Phycisphaerales bacterium]|nr:ATP-binding protein [Phycisphaerales bacterium]
MSDSIDSISQLSPKGILASMRIRKKLIVLHTAFSISLGVVLLLAIRPAMSKVIFGAEFDLSEQMMTLFFESDDSLENPVSRQFDTAHIMIGNEATKELSDQIIFDARQNAGKAIPVPSDGFATGVVRWIPESDQFVLIRARATRARETIRLVYILVIATLIAGYALVAAALEVFVLPKHVYQPIREILDADQAVRDGNQPAEIIPESAIPADEIGSIMRSRNDSIRSLRTHEKELAQALELFEHTAADLHKKNHLLETARKNLEGADRLASLGMMSAGIAHELNTPLAVVKGLVDKLNSQKELSHTEIALLARVVTRLEKLSDGLLDFARVRPPMEIEIDLYNLVEEASTLVEIDKKEQFLNGKVQVQNSIESNQVVHGDPDRLLQVFLNLIRNAVDALGTSKKDHGLVQISAAVEIRDKASWLNIRVVDNGPGIDANVIDSLFEPFVSSRLDSHGTGLGLAVTNGIVREHGGVLIATNRAADDTESGAVFEVLLPAASSTNNHSTDMDVL